jgi:hypothetical protein
LKESFGIRFHFHEGSLSSATTLLPGQDKLAPSSPISAKSRFVVSFGVRLQEVVRGTITKPRVIRHLCNNRTVIAQETLQNTEAEAIAGVPERYKRRE